MKIWVLLLYFISDAICAFNEMTAFIFILAFIFVSTLSLRGGDYVYYMLFTFVDLFLNLSIITLFIIL